MLSRRVAIISIALGSALLFACQEKILTPTELETVRTSSEAYLAYAREDCAAVLRLVDENQLEIWAFDEMRHSTLLLRGFCSEVDGDKKAARDVYRSLILEAPNSFAANDAVERMRVLKLIENDPEFEQRIRSAQDRRDPDKPKRTPIDRVPAQYPPLAKARGIGGYAVIEFKITERGDTEDPIVVESSPGLLFDGSALRAVRRWQYMRQPSAGENDQTLIRIRFEQDAVPNVPTAAGIETEGTETEETEETETETDSEDHAAEESDA